MHQDPSSFRDPAGYVFMQEGEVYRLVATSYFSEYDHFMKCGLYEALVRDRALIPHTLVSKNEQEMVLKPERIPFISYPAEWSFGMLKEAALLHLKINVLALKHGMLLKDASGYNVQFIGSQAVFIDTCSFARYLEDKPWYAFGQFCRHFIAPLLLMKYNAPDINRLLSNYLDGIELDLAARLLPFRTRFQPFIQTTICRHAAKVDKNKHKHKNTKLSKKMLCRLFAYLQSSLENVQLPSWKTEWHDYYNNMSYSPIAFAEKKQIVTHWLKEVSATRMWDIGGNIGLFSRDSTTPSNYIITCDKDPRAIEQAWQQNKQQNTNNHLPLMLDITNPTPAHGFANIERSSFLQRIKSANIDCSLALAVLHHLCITHNCNFKMLAQLFATTTQHLIIEFVHRQDSSVIDLLTNMRENYSAFAFYHQENFTAEFAHFFEIIHAHKINSMHRTLYLMKSKLR